MILYRDSNITRLLGSILLTAALIGASQVAIADPASAGRHSAGGIRGELATIDLTTAEGGKNLPVAVKVKTRCMFGDLDAIGLDLLHSKKRKLLLTVESLIPGDKSFPPLVRTITSSPFGKGFRMEFRLPESERPQVLGIFVCKDSADAGLCNEKEVAKISDIISTYDARTELPAGYQPTDKIFFFQFLMVEGGRVSFLKGPLVRRGYDALAQELKPSFGDQTSSLIERLTRLLETIASEPLEDQRGDLTVILPRNDLGKCLGK